MNNLYISSIATQISDVIIEYYISYQRKHININNNISRSLLQKYISDILINAFNQRYSVDKKISSIDILYFPYECRYELIHNLDDDIICDINNKLSCYLNNHIIINNEYEVISINICPFEGLVITHGAIINTLDLYFY